MSYNVAEGIEVGAFPNKKKMRYTRAVKGKVVLIKGTTKSFHSKDLFVRIYVIFCGIL